MRSRKQTPPDIERRPRRRTAGDDSAADDAAEYWPSRRRRKQRPPRPRRSRPPRAPGPARSGCGGRPKPLKAKRMLTSRQPPRWKRDAGTAGTEPAEVGDVDTETSDVVVAPADTTEVDKAGSDTEDSDEGVVEEPVDAEPVRKRRRWRAARILKTLVAALAVACTAALVTLSVLMVLDHRQASRTAAQGGVRRSGPAERRDTDVAGLQQGQGRRTAHHRQLDRSVQDDFKNTSGRFHQGGADSKVVTETNVTATAVESMTDDTATVSSSRPRRGSPTPQAPSRSRARGGSAWTWRETAAR